MTPDFTWLEAFLTQEAATAPRLAGYYNDNYIVAHQGQRYVVRVPIPSSAVMDVRRLPEAAVLRLLEAHAVPAPRLLHTLAGTRVAVHSFIAGRVLNAVYADRSPLPDWIDPHSPYSSRACTPSHPTTWPLPAPIWR